MFSVLFVDIFDTIGTLIGVSDRAGMLDKEGKLPQIKPALLADAIATCAGAILGTSTTTTFVESSAGVGAGARTGLASVVTGLMFLIAIFFAPIFTTIPTFAIAPALIYVGFLMLSAIVDVDFKNLRQGVPAFLTVLCMPLMYSISEGIAVGIISYVVINLIANAMTKNKEDREPVTPLMIVLAIIFVLKYALL
jgi:AGZA family xanthine/uracil permease-like MFS transporter